MADALRGGGTLRRGRPSLGTRRGLVLAFLVFVAWVAWHWLPVTPPPPELPSPATAEPSSPAIPSPSPSASTGPPTPAAITVPSTTLRPSPLQSSPPSRDVEPSLPPPATPAPVAAAPPPARAEEVAAPPTTITRPAGLLVVVKPWADVSIDGVPRGQTPLARLDVTPGAHQVVLSHPAYQPWVRRVVVAPGETLRLDVDLSVDAVRRRN